MLSNRTNVGWCSHETSSRCQISFIQVFSDELFWEFFWRSSFTPLQPIYSNIPLTTRPRLDKTKRTKHSPRKCVGPQSTSTKVLLRMTTSEPLVSVPLKPMRKDVSWHDSLFPRHHATATPSRRHFPLQIQEPLQSMIACLVSLIILISPIPNVNWSVVI